MDFRNWYPVIISTIYKISFKINILAHFHEDPLSTFIFFYIFRKLAKKYRRIKFNIIVQGSFEIDSKIFKLKI